MHVTIDPALRDLLPPPSDESRKKLKESIELHGIQEAPVAYCPDHGRDAVLLDAHTRYILSCEIDGIDPEAPGALSQFFADTRGIIDHTVVTQADAKQWVIDRQIGRRNCTPEEMKYLRGLDYTLAKQAHGGDRSSGQNVHLKTAEKIAKKHGVNEKTIRRDSEFVENLEAVEAVVPGTKIEVLAGRRKIPASRLKLAAQAAKREEENAKVKDACEAAGKGEALVRAVLDKTAHMTDAEVAAAVSKPGTETANTQAVFTAKVSCIVQYLTKDGPAEEIEKTRRGIKSACKYHGRVLSVDVIEKPAPVPVSERIITKDLRTKVRATVEFDLDLPLNGGDITDGMRKHCEDEIAQSLHKCTVINPRMTKGWRKVMKQANVDIRLDIQRQPEQEPEV